MAKRYLRSIMIGFCVFTFTIIVAYVVYMYANNLSARETNESVRAETPVAAETLQPVPPEEGVTKHCYIARYDGISISIYAVNDGREEFLYTLDARIEDISVGELIQLSNGIKLPDKQSLASFEEDFTS